MAASIFSRSVIVWAIALALAVSSGASAFSEALAVTRPAVVYGLGFNNGVAVRAVAERTLEEGQGKVPLSAQQLARLLAALKANPLDRRLLRILMADRYVRGEGAEALKIALLSSRISRRDLPTQTFLIVNAAEEADYDQMTFHLDAALSTRNRSYDILFPLMMQSLGDAKFRKRLIPLFEARRPWVDSFISYAVSNPEGLDAVVSLVEDALPSLGADMRPMAANVIDLLVARGDVGRADIFARQRLGFDADRSNALALDDASIDPLFAPLSWTFANAPEVVATAIEESKIEIQVSSLTWKLAVERTIAAAPGAYVVKADIVGHLTEGYSGETRWVIQCVVDNQKITLAEERIRLRSGLETLRVPIEIRRSCSGIALEIFAKTGEEGSESIIVIENLLLAAQ